ncbi:MAG: small subunit ribosomal protein S18 [Planctomycetota bacterium]|jgi:small subunit ribosomal protein S18
MAMGRKARRGGRGLVKLGKKTDVDHALSYLDADHLLKFLTPQGQIQGRRRTGFCAQTQRKLKKEVKRARHIGLLPFVG